MGGTNNDFGNSIAIGSNGNVYTTGSFSSTADFDPSVSIFNLTTVSSGYRDTFVSKLDSDGNFLWAKSMGGASDDGGQSIIEDSSGNVYTMGYFWGTADFDPGVGTLNLTSSGNKDIFVSKLGGNGDFAWAKSMGGMNSDEGHSIAIDSSDNIFITGDFTGIVDFDPGAGTANLTSAGNRDTFVSELDNNGGFVWAKSVGGTDQDLGYGIAADSSNSIYTTGSFSGTADFVPGAGTFNLTSAGNSDIFVSKLQSDHIPPTIASFTATSPLSNPNIPITAFVASDAVGVTGYLITTSATVPSAGAAGWTSIIPTAYAVASDGYYTLYPWAKDEAGNVSSVFASPGAVVVDTTKPTSTVTALPSTSPANISLSWSGSDALSGLSTFDVQVRAGIDGAWTDIFTNTSATSTTYNGVAGVTYYFRTRAMDVVGNVEDWPADYDTYTLVDADAPTGTLVINNGALSTTFVEVKLTLSAQDVSGSVAQMSFSNDGSTWDNWQTYAGSVDWSLSGGDGLRTVYVRFKDISDNVSSPISSTITLDTAAGTEYGLSINQGTLFTNQATVTLSIAAKQFTTQMMISNDGGFVGATWEPYNSLKPWTITQYGSYVLPRVVYVRYNDINGNVSATYQDDIILDVTPPTGAISITSQPNGFELTASTVTLSLSATDDVSGVGQMLISNQADFADATWENYATSRVWTPGSAPAVYVKFKDNAGNVSSVYSTIETAIFSDVPLDYWASTFIERLYNAGITGGCSLVPLMYCPETNVNRAQMAVFLLRGEHGSAYIPPAVGTGTGFTDVPADYWAAAWIKQLALEGITSGCGPSLYCPETSVTRDQMAVFLLRAEHGAFYTPPPATGVFTDVPTTHWAASWIEQLAAEGITGGCGADTYCPSTPVTRAQMAVFLVRAFNLP